MADLEFVSSDQELVVSWFLLRIVDHVQSVTREVTKFLGTRVYRQLSSELPVRLGCEACKIPWPRMVIHIEKMNRLLLGR